MKKVWSSLCGILPAFSLEPQDMEERLYRAGLESLQLQVDTFEGNSVASTFALDCPPISEPKALRS